MMTAELSKYQTLDMRIQRDFSKLTPDKGSPTDNRAGSTLRFLVFLLIRFNKDFLRKSCLRTRGNAALRARAGL